MSAPRSLPTIVRPMADSENGSRDGRSYDLNSLATSTEISSMKSISDITGIISAIESTLADRIDKEREEVLKQILPQCFGDDNKPDKEYLKQVRSTLAAKHLKTLTGGNPVEGMRILTRHKITTVQELLDAYYVSGTFVSPQAADDEARLRQLLEADIDPVSVPPRT